MMIVVCHFILMSRHGASVRVAASESIFISVRGCNIMTLAEGLVVVSGKYPVCLGIAVMNLAYCSGYKRLDLERI
jgi:hypothetical protein